MVVDASTENPITGVRVIASWLCRDFPYPHIGEYSVSAHATTDEKGLYVIKKPRRRDGWFGGDFSFTVYAKGYISAGFYLRPGSPSLTGDTKAYPFEDITSVPTFPAVLNIRLRPAPGPKACSGISIFPYAQNGKTRRGPGAQRCWAITSPKNAPNLRHGES